MPSVGQLETYQLEDLSSVMSYDLYRRWHSILMRTWLASRELLQKSGKVVLSSDASRFQTDTLVGVLGTYTGEDEFTVTVPSPQVLLMHLGFRVCRFRFLTETQNLL